MYESEFILVLKDAVRYNIIISLLLWVPCISSCFVFLYERRKNVKHDPRSKRMAGVVLAFILVIVIPVITCVKCIPIYQDISQNQIECATGCFSKHNGSNTESIILSNGSEYFTEDHGNLTLYVPLGYDDSVPNGSFCGTIWYGRSSNIIVAIEVEDHAEEDK